jgi:ribosome biogenesis GTPase
MENEIIGRVYSQYKGIYKVIIDKDEITAEISGKFRYEIESLLDYPAVGDYVVLDRKDNYTGNAIIQRVLSRKSVFVRKAAGTGNDVQVIAANIDKVFICMSLNHDFNLRRLERYLAIAWDSGAEIVVVLTKSDICTNIDEMLASVENVAIGVKIMVTTSMNEEGYESIIKNITEGQTVAFIGSSGVGKSTLINKLLGENRIKTAETGENDKGHHTTTKRELISIPSGGFVIDTPGMRELGLESTNLSKAFSDIDQLAGECKFANCTHKSEPGCAVLKAIQDGHISEKRLISYEKLKKETKYDGLNSKQREKEKMETMFEEFGGVKNAKAFIKSKKMR